MLSQSHIRGLLQSLDFSEGSGTALTDKSGNNNHATIVGGTWTADRFGRANRAILLDGVDDYIDLGLANYQGDLSAIVSFKPVTNIDGACLINKGWRNNNTQYPPAFRQILRTANTIQSNNMWVGSNGAIGNVTYTYDNNWSIAYNGWRDSVGGSHGANGRQLTALNSNFDTNWSAYNIEIGKYQNQITGSFVIDRIMLFNRFLSGHELSKLANRLKIGDMNK